MFGQMIFRIRGPAIDAAEIAAVGHGNAQVRNLPSEFIDECHRQLDAAKNKKAQFRFGKWATIPADHDKRCRACWIHSFPNLGGFGVFTRSLNSRQNKSVARQPWIVSPSG
jgi:hypothetical protein